MVLQRKKKKDEGEGGEGASAVSPDTPHRSSIRRSKKNKWPDVEPSELRAYKKLFKEIDTDGSGGIDRKELRRAMRKRTMKISEEKINEVFEEVDKNRDGLLDLDEFIAGMISFKPKEMEKEKGGNLKSGLVWFRREGLRSRLSDDQLKFYKDAFGTMDEAGRGCVNAQQFFDLIKFLGVATDLRTVKKLIAAQDPDGKGEIDFDGFLEMISRRADGEGLRQSGKGLKAWKEWFRDDVQRTITAIEDQERRAAARQERIDVAMQTVKGVFNKEQMDHFRKKYDELVAHVSGTKSGKAGLDYPAIAWGLVEEGGFEKKDAKREAKVLVTNASLDDDKLHVTWEAFVFAMASKKEGWNLWWRGDKVTHATKSFDASGGAGLLGAIADTTQRVNDTQQVEKLAEQDAREESALVAKMKRLRAKRERENAPKTEEEHLTPRDSPRRLPPILQQLQNAVYSDDELSPRSELLGGVRKFLYDKYAGTETDDAGETDTAQMVAAGKASTTTLGVALDSRSNYLYGKAYCPGPPPSYSPDPETPEENAAFLFRAGQIRSKAKAQAAVDETLASALGGRLSNFGGVASSAAPTIAEGDEDADDDDAPAEERDTPFDIFREKMARDLVLVMAYQQHVASLPANLKKLNKQLALFDWPSLLDWSGVIDDLKENGTIYCAVDGNGRPYEVYF